MLLFVCISLNKDENFPRILAVFGSPRAILEIDVKGVFVYLQFLRLDVQLSLTVKKIKHIRIYILGFLHTLVVTLW